VEGGGIKGAKSGRNRENTQHCAIFCKRRKAKRREATQIGREPGLKGTGSGSFNSLPCPPSCLRDQSKNVTLTRKEYITNLLANLL